uniref:Gypsy retrotransposon integrase-like protein 1 n=1 Tax=Anguilla anguilla TaxID=7936 RepID=A0A0E9TTT6_ANGAN
MGLRVIIPTALRPKLLKDLHEEHLGIVKTKAVSRSHFWWPNLDKEI